MRPSVAQATPAEAATADEAPSEGCQCPYAIVREGRLTKMVFDCREDPGPATLANRACRIRVLEALGREFAVDAVVLSDFIETQYTEESLELLLRLNELNQDLKRLGLRDPYAAYFAGREDLSSAQKSKQRETCQGCTYNPMRMFPSLEETFAANVVKGYAEFGRGAEVLQGADRPPVCNPCLEASAGDFAYLHDRLEALRSHILYHGFRITESKGGE